MSTANGKVYIDLDQLKEAEVSRAFELERLMQTRLEIKALADELEVRRKEVDGCLKEFLEGFSADGAIVGDRIATLTHSRSGGKWNKERLVMILSPEELERVYTEGKEYSYVKVDESTKRAGKIRAEMS